MAVSSNGTPEMKTKQENVSFEDMSKENKIKFMIEYLSTESEYKVVTSDEFGMLKDKKHDKGADKGPASGGTPQPQTGTGVTNPTTSTPVIPKMPPFSGENKGGEVTFDVWKYEVKCLLREGCYSKPIVQQAMRNSLRGKARSLLVTLPEQASPQAMLEKLDGVYGNAFDHEALMENFYKQRQEDGESLSDYGMRLESLIQVPYERKKISTEARNEMLCSKFFSGLRDPMLQNASRFKYDTVKDFDMLRKEVRSIELQMACSKPESAVQKAAVKQQAHSNITLEDVMKKLDGLTSKMSKFESDLKSVKQSGTNVDYAQSQRGDSQFEGSHRGNSQRGSYSRGNYRGGYRGSQRGGFDQYQSDDSYRGRGTSDRGYGNRGFGYRGYGNRDFGGPRGQSRGYRGRGNLNW